MRNKILNKFVLFYKNKKNKRNVNKLLKLERKNLSNYVNSHRYINNISYNDKIDNIYNYYINKYYNRYKNRNYAHLYHVIKKNHSNKMFTIICHHVNDSNSYINGSYKHTNPNHKIVYDKTH